MSKEYRSTNSKFSKHSKASRHLVVRHSFFVILSTFVLLHSSFTPLPAAEPDGLSLFSPSGLSGWDYGASPLRGWQLAGGRLSGSAAATPLLSGFTFGDFTIRFHWSASGGDGWRISLPRAPSGETIAILLAEGDHCARVQQAERVLAEGGAVKPIEGGVHSATVHRAAGKLSVDVDGVELASADVPAADRYGLMLAIDRGTASLADLRLIEPPGEAIYRGSLEGWWTPGNLQSWVAGNEGLTCINQGGNYLRTEKEYGNFTLSLEYKMARGGNSGIGIRTARDGWPSGDGIELQLLDEPPGTPLTRSSTMALYGNLEPLASADRSEEWNRAVIKTDGPMISAWINGVLVQQADLSRLPELQHRHLQGWIGFQDHGARIEFRDVRVLEAPAGDGLEAWRSPPAAGPAWQVLDRLMNPQQLATPDKFASGTARATISGEETVVAELTGPGVLVRLLRSNESGRLAFYFDGEAKPRIDCPAEQLAQHLPQFCQDRNPLLTCLPYASRLKIVAREAAAGDVRCDFVSFPSDAAVASYAADDLPPGRGMLPALTYRHEQFGWGTHREADPLPRASALPRTIEPGSAGELISLEGAGVLRWLKLLADKQVLAGDDLWLEVTVDSEPAPALSAPARYLYPGLQGGENYPNFVVVERGGFTSLLAMPFGRGIRIAAVNRGAQPLEVGLAVSVERIDDAGRLPPWRLRGVFEKAAGDSRIIRQTGAGRLIGLVCETPASDLPRIESFEIDGKPQPGYAGASLGEFFGVGHEDVRHCLGGRRGGLSWSYLLLTPIDFQKSLLLQAAEGPNVGGRLALFYRP